MGKIAETAMSVIICCFLTKEKNFRFLFSFAAKKRKFAISVCSKQMVVAVFHPFPLQYIYIYTYRKCFPFAPYKWKLLIQFVCFRWYIHIYRKQNYIYIHMLPFQTKYGNRSPGDFPSSVYRLLIIHMEVCDFSICWQGNKQKLSIWHQTKMD